MRYMANYKDNSCYMHQMPSAAGNNNKIVIRRKDSLSFEEIYQWLKDLRNRPFVEQSHFDVTSILKIKTDEGIFYVGGVNIENIELNMGTCAEEGAIAAAVTAFGERIDILEGWVMGAPRGTSYSDIACYPCGECRQRLAQYTAPNAPFHIVTLSGEKKDTKTRAELLPMAFSFRDMEDTGKNLLAAPILQHNFSCEERLFLAPDKPLTHQEIFAWLQDLQSDVRVSGIDRRLVFKLTNGAYVSGVKMENAAYPASITAIQTAISIMHARFGMQKIAEIWTSIIHRNHSVNEQHSDTFMPFSGAALQVIFQFVSEESIPVHIFTTNGNCKSTTLRELIGSPLAFSKFALD